MTDTAKIKPIHIQRAAVVYVRQSTTSQVEQHRESTARQYALAERARQLGWTKEQVLLIDEDLGLSGASVSKRTGFVCLTTEVALGRVGIVLGLEVSRLARNNADWYRLLDLCGLTDTLIGDGDGLYHPALFNDRLVLGLKGTMSEAELHILRARLDGGIRNKAARGELYRGLSVGFVRGEEDGEVLFIPMKLSPTPFVPSLSASLNSVPHVRFGSGFCRKVCRSLYSGAVRFAGSLPPTLPFTAFLPILFMPALTLTASRVLSVMLMNTVWSENEFATCS